jgi:hypothetical protein
MSKLVDLKDSNGTSLQSYITTLIDKVDEISPEATLTIIIASPPDQLDVVSSVQLQNLPDALSQLASIMRSGPEKVGVVNPKETQVN